MDGGRDHLFIADSGHHQVVVTTLPGAITKVYGDGTAGLVDGALGTARFNKPLGLALDIDGETLYVADSENHAIRAIALRSGRVTTVVGTGQQTSNRKGDGAAREIALSSPWDIAIDGDRLWIAMAGTHQLWTLDLRTGQIAVAAGTGAESIHDGPPLEATFAQPSGLAVHDGDVYVADSESSAVRRVSEREGRVRRLLGRGSSSSAMSMAPAIRRGCSTRWGSRLMQREAVRSSTSPIPTTTRSSGSIPRPGR